VTVGPPAAVDYLAFGGRLRSELEFPDLSPARGEGHPDWSLRIEASAPPASLEFRGSREIAPDWAFRLHRVENGLRLDYGGTGSYGIHSGGREIVWYPGTEPEDPALRMEMVRAILLGPVMALALHEAGVLCLHGSAVAIGDRAVAFLAPKFHGKSTLALALTDAGARLLSDDLVAVRPGEPPTVLPGVHSVRVMRDVADRVGARFPEATSTPGFKTTLTNLSPEDLAWSPVGLAAIYLLAPKRELADGKSANRRALSPARAAAALAYGKKVTDELVGLVEAGSMLQSIADVVARVPVYELFLVRDLDRLPGVVREILAWHEAG
jgi:hypothetical protein